MYDLSTAIPQQPSIYVPEWGVALLGVFLSSLPVSKTTPSAALFYLLVVAIWWAWCLHLAALGHHFGTLGAPWRTMGEAGRTRGGPEPDFHGFGDILLRDCFGTEA